MLQNVSITTILLLGALIFLIYMLTKSSSDNFENTDDKSKQALVIPPQQVQEKLEQGLPIVSNDIIHQILTEGNTNNTPALNNGSAFNKEENVQQTSLYNYLANDEDVAEGASLDMAFEKPLPENTKTDVVDLNKNNVANYSAQDFLPKEINDSWFNTDFSQAKYKMNDDKLINTDRYVIGVNTVGQSLKNASYDIRGAVAVPKFSISPFNNSTIEPDYNIKPLC
jgi:hypothetical protein